MIDLHKTWPLGLSRRNVLVYLLAFVVLIVVLQVLDRPISAWGTGLPSSVHAIFGWITQWGESGWILIPALVFWLVALAISLVTKETLKAAAAEFAAIWGFVLLGVGLPSLAATLLKRIFGRGRPETWSADVPLSFQPFNWSAWAYQSFPSGHATTAFSLAMVVVFLWPRAFWPALVFASAVAVSRIIVGAHYPTDITAGALLGILGAYAVRELFAARGWLFSSADGRTERRPFQALARLLKR